MNLEKITRVKHLIRLFESRAAAVFDQAEADGSFIVGTAATGALRPHQHGTDQGARRSKEARLMPGIAEFLAEGSNKLIVAELPDGSVMLTVANTITHERHSITMRAHRGARRRQPVPSTGSDPLRALGSANGDGGFGGHCGH